MENIVKTHKNRKGAICFNSASNKWRARSMINGKYKHLGMFESEKQAQVAINDLLYNIAHNQYIDPVKVRQNKRDQKELERLQAFASSTISLKELESRKLLAISQNKKLKYENLLDDPKEGRGYQSKLENARLAYIIAKRDLDDFNLS